MSFFLSIAGLRGVSRGGQDDALPLVFVCPCRVFSCLPVLSLRAIPNFDLEAP
jgi:hypothetical protein